MHYLKMLGFDSLTIGLESQYSAELLRRNREGTTTVEDGCITQYLPIQKDSL